MSTTRTDYISARVEPKLKRDAIRFLGDVGLSASDAITLFLRQVVIHRGLPFEARVPNAETRRAIAELEDPKKRKRLKSYATSEKMFEDILGKNWRDEYA
jgi:DNA-damage-inducible protein J